MFMLGRGGFPEDGAGGPQASDCGSSKQGKETSLVCLFLTPV